MSNFASVSSTSSEVIKVSAYCHTLQCTLFFFRVFCFNNPDWPLNVEPDVKHYTCRKTNFVNNTIYWGEYNESEYTENIIVFYDI